MRERGERIVINVSKIKQQTSEEIGMKITQFCEFIKYTRWEGSKVVFVDVLKGMVV